MFANPDAAPLILAALVGGAAGKLLKIPGGALIAATSVVAFSGIYWNLSHATPTEMVPFLQLFMGCMLGQSINRRFWSDLLQLWRPTLFVVGGFTLLAAPFVLFLVTCYSFDPLTAVLASTPARMQDMVVLAGSLDRDAVTVMLMHLARQFALIGATPFVVAKYRKQVAPGTERKKTTFRLPHFSAKDAVNWIILLVPASIGGFIGSATGHILGILLGSFFAVAATRLIWLRAGEVPFPKILTFLIQSFTGLLLGTRITPETGALLMERLAPVALSCLYVVVGGWIIAHALRRRYAWNDALCWLAAAPGRTIDMLSIAQDLNLPGRDILALASVHAVRQVYFTLLVSFVMAFI